MNFNAPHWRSGYMPLIIGGIGAMASALFMPWVTVVTPEAGAITRAGIQMHDGRLLALGLIALALVARSEARTPKAATRSVLLAGVAVMAAALFLEYRALINIINGIEPSFSGWTKGRLDFGIFAMGLGLTFSLAGVLKRRIALQPSQEDAERFAA